jgi:hypothetical protein
MNDDFLTRNRLEVRQEFKDTLYASLVEAEDQRRTGQIKHVFGYVAGAIVLALGLLFTFSSPARAEVADWIKQIAGMNVAEVTESPLTDVTEAPGMIVEPSVVHVSQIEGPPFSFNMPQYIPEGFVLSKDFAIADSKQWVMLSWTKSTDYEITMLVEIHDDQLVIPAGVGSSEEVEVNHQPALLIRGNWANDSQWDMDRGLDLQWLQGNLRYELKYTKIGKNGEIIPFSKEEIDERLVELMQMAGSIN